MVRNILNEELGGHRGSYNPVIITNKEAHMIFGNMNKESEGSSQTANIAKTGNENFRLFCVFTHVASIYANLLKQKKAFT